MSLTPATDKIAIQSILSTDPYLRDYLGFVSKEYYRVRATDTILGDKTKLQVFIYNVTPEATINPIIYGMVYEIDVSAPYANNGTVDLAIEQIVALLNGVEVAKTHRLELLDPPMVLSSDTALYQMGVRFVCYDSLYNKKKNY